MKCEAYSFVYLWQDCFSYWSLLWTLERSSELGFLSYSVPHWAREYVAVQIVSLVLRGSQPGTLSHQYLDLGETETNPLGSLTKRLNVRHISLSLPREKLRLLEFSPNCHTVLGERTMISKCVLVWTITFVWSSPQPVVLRSKQERNQSLRKCSQKVGTLDVLKQFSLSLLKEKPQSREFPPDRCTVPGGETLVRAMNFPTPFNVVGLLLPWCRSL